MSQKGVSRTDAGGIFPPANHKGDHVMKRTLVAMSMSLFVSFSAYAQTVGQYRGRTSQSQDIQFGARMQGQQLCVDPIGFAAFLACPSGTRTSWGSSFFGCNPIGADGSFTVTLAAVDGAIPTYVVSGQFTSDTAAEGTISFQAAHLRVTGKEVDAQLCDSGTVTWTANFSGGATEQRSDSGSEMNSYTDKATGKTSVFFRLDPK